MGKKNNLFIISGPSGAGEDSIIGGIEKEIDIERVITTTTRKMRKNEKEGNPYYFISKNEFLKKIEKNFFFEWAKQYNNNYYGVSYEEIQRVQKSSNIGIWKIEYKGVIQAKKLIPNIKAILINAPIKILEKRIRNRSSVKEEFIKERISYTKEWLKHKNIYDFEIINEEGKLKKSISKAIEIINNHS